MKWVFKIIGGVLLVALGLFLFGYVTMYLWNWIMPYLFHLPIIDMPMAIGMVILSKILFGGVRMRGGHSSWWEKKRALKEKWATMTPEEREKFKSEFAQRCRHKWGGSMGMNTEKSE